MVSQRETACVPDRVGLEDGRAVRARKRESIGCREGEMEIEAEFQPSCC